MVERSNAYRDLENAIVQSGKPHLSVEFLARDARSIGLLDDVMYFILQHSTPFSGFSQMTLVEIEHHMQATQAWASQVRDRSYWILTRYALKHEMDNLYYFYIKLLPL